MLASTFVRMVSVTSLLLIIVLFPTSNGIYAGCDCSDCTNLYNRYNQVNALLTEVCAQKADLEAAHQENDPFNPGFYDDNLLQT
jgi:hypothetical protein